MLYSPLKLRNITLNNRWVMSPMCMYSAEEGVLTDFHTVHYVTRAQGGVGLIVVEATGIEPRGRITHRCAGLWNAAQEEAFRRLVRLVHDTGGTKIGIQLAHAGRKASTWEGVQLPEGEGWETVAPSALPYKDGELLPHALREEEIQELVHQFQEAARRAVSAGFDVVEIHAAHGYLLHQFLSPLSNVRTDAYGGSFENRVRFLLEVVDAVQAVLDEEHPLFVRLSATEYAEGGWDVSDTVALSRMLKARGVDVVDVSSGGNIQGARISVFDGYQVPFSSAVRKEGIVTGAVGQITTASQARSILEAGDADLIFVGRELLRNPYLPTHGAWEEGAACYFPEAYARAKK